MTNLDISDKKFPMVEGLRDFQENRGTVRHCKIVGTLGPSSSNEKTLRELIEAGIDIVRLNFSHGTHEQHKSNIDLVRRLSKEAGRHVAILQDRFLCNCPQTRGIRARYFGLPPTKHSRANIPKIRKARSAPSAA